jgi:hypothetical protein
MPLALRESSMPASRIEALRSKRAKIDEELRAESQHLSVPELTLKEKKKIKLLLRDQEEGIRRVSQ